MARYLSEAWLAQLETAATPVLRPGTGGAGTALTIQQVVTGGPDGDVAYVLEISDGSLRARLGRAETPDVSVTEDHATAVALATGRLSMQAAVRSGRIRVRGDVRSLQAGAAALAGVSNALDRVRADTDWG